ncbi:NAD(P)-dependent oxidoreductase, partial [bacterium]|nr:NAD(P)-dependent oxidoreductase [bacterium]
MKTALITGAHGFLGRYVARHFSSKGYRVIGIGHGHWGFEDPAHYGIDRWIEADIDFANLAEMKDSFDCIVHCAGGSSVGYSCLYPLQDFTRTVDATAEVLEYMRLHQREAKLIYPS